MCGRLQAAQVEAVLRRGARQHHKVRLWHRGGQRRRGHRLAEPTLHRGRSVDVLVGVKRVSGVGAGEGSGGRRPGAQREAGTVAGALQSLQQEARVLVHHDRLVSGRAGGVRAVANVGALS